MLTLVPVSLKEANAFVAANHRHHKPVTGHKFSIDCKAEGRLGERTGQASAALLLLAFIPNKRSCGMKNNFIHKEGEKNRKQGFIRCAL